jgi:hypothetical protein
MTKRKRELQVMQGDICISKASCFLAEYFP